MLSDLLPARMRGQAGFARCQGPWFQRAGLFMAGLSQVFAGGMLFAQESAEGLPAGVQIQEVSLASPSVFDRMLEAGPVEQAVVLSEGEVVGPDDLPISPAASEADPLRLMIPGVTLAELERFAILRTLEACGGSPTKAAAVLGISRRTIQYRLQEWGLNRPPRGAPDNGEPAGV